MHLRVSSADVPGSPFPITVTASTPCPRASVPNTFTAPFVACSPLQSPSGTAFQVDVPLRDCWGNAATLSAAQVRLSSLLFVTFMKLVRIIPVGEKKNRVTCFFVVVWCLYALLRWCWGCVGASSLGVTHSSGDGSRLHLMTLCTAKSIGQFNRCRAASCAHF